MLPIKEDDNKLFSKLVTKENSVANPSFRVYYGGNSVAVPFVWEAKPGTPKHTKHIDYSKEEENKQYLPPLTPPPSYYLNQPKKLPTNGSSKRSSSSRIFLGLFPKSMHRRQISTASSLSSSSTLSCPSSSMLMSDTSTMRGSEESRSLSLSLSLSRGCSRRRRTLSSPGSLFDFLVNGHEDDEQQEDMASPRSVLCFGLVGSRRIRSC